MTRGTRCSSPLADGDVVTEEDGRLILHVDGEDIDITEELETEGVYDYAYDMEVVREDGSRETRTVTIEVTGTPENWTVTQDNGDGVGLRDRRRQRRRGGLRHRHGTGADGSGELPAASGEDAEPEAG